MKIVTVVENESLNNRLEGEFGLSLMLETNDDMYLIDQGPSDVVLRNLKKLGYFVENIKNIIVSHNHGDHVNGLEPLLKVNDIATVYMSEYAVGEYVKYKDGNLKILSTNSSIYVTPLRFKEISDMEFISHDVALCHVKNPKPQFKCKDKYLFEIVDAKLIPDEFKHEIYVCAFRPDGMYNIISPCSHNGIINIINDAQERFPDKKLNAFVGGLHLQGSDKKLKNLTDDDVVALAENINKTPLQALYTCHCTGEYAFNILKQHLHCKSQYLHTGDEIII